MAIAEAQQRAALAEQRLSDLKAMLDDMRAQRDARQAQAEQLDLPSAPLRFHSGDGCAALGERRSGGTLREAAGEQSA